MPETVRAAATPVAAAAAAAAVDDDEDRLVIPDRWRPLMHPRRGIATPDSVRMPEHTGSADALSALSAVHGTEAEARVRSSLEDPRTPPFAAEALRRRLAGAASPLGTAISSLLSTEQPGTELPEHLDAWIIAFGLPFAGVAIVEAARLDISTLRGQWEPAVRESREPGLPRTLAAAARRLRTYLSVASDEVYSEAVRALAEYRRDLRQRAVVSYLLPTESGWLAEVCAEAGKARLGTREWGPLVALLHCSVARPEELAALRKRRLFRAADSDLGVIATAVESLGVAALDLLANLLVSRSAKSDATMVLDVVARIPCDEAFAVLTSRLTRKRVQAVVMEVARLYPRRAIRMLAAAACGEGENAEIARNLLAGQLSRRAELIPMVRPMLTDGESALVDAICARSVGRPEAPDSVLPDVLVSPPWTRKGRSRGVSTASAAAADGSATRGAAAVVLQAPAVCRVAWNDGEREEFARHERQFRAWGRQDPPEARTQIEESGTTGTTYRDWHILLNAPEDEARRTLAFLRMSFSGAYQVPGYGAIIARFDADAIDPLLRAQGAGPAALAELLAPVVDLRVARLMADWMLRLKGSARVRARGWLGRHSEDAAILLIPDALGTQRELRAPAETALRYLVAGVRLDVVQLAERAYGREAAVAVRTIVDLDPLDLVPARLPKFPDWLLEAPLPQILLRDRRTALPAPAMGHVLTMLAISSPGEPYAGLDIVKEYADPVSLASFGRALLAAWRSVDYPRQESWILWAQSTLGDAETVRYLVPLLVTWPREGGHRRAAVALEVLAELGTDCALIELHRIARAFPRKALNQHAHETLADLAARTGLTVDQLADRLLPDLGLDAQAARWLDYGPRRFRVRYDGHLRPSIFDGAGAEQAEGLPVPAVTATGTGANTGTVTVPDDLELAEAARHRLAGLTHEVDLVVTHALRRLESSMVMSRSWSTEEFHTLLLDHPLLRHLTVGLVWLGEADGVATAFRVAEDFGFADVDDKEFELDERAVVRVAHPLELGTDVGAWAELFADYEILQPFPQLGRPVHALTDDERAGTVLRRFEETTAPAAEVRAMLEREWDTRSEISYAFADRIVRATPDGRWLTLGLTPSVDLSTAEIPAARHRLGAVTLERTREAPSPDTESSSAPLHDLDPITASELLADLYRLSDR